ncbi:hypothetical protein E4T50_14668 [Aureobasidium sp. EXF-12298]|nr:hypothetical protein E4T50_14668 [Aureobasidium sp. EXF-12298]KAI4752455.1 hypothetical protein E4T51_14382 [Aureobasidium sp. EXF-12344]KAI4769668.1 hypothetical protein E4T52_15303 [Aureobasidium sp. EXF-3400]
MTPCHFLHRISTTYSVSMVNAKAWIAGVVFKLKLKSMALGAKFRRTPKSTPAQTPAPASHH